MGALGPGGGGGEQRGACADVGPVRRHGQECGGEVHALQHPASGPDAGARHSPPRCSTGSAHWQEDQVENKKQKENENPYMQNSYKSKEEPIEKLDNTVTYNI